MIKEVDKICYYLYFIVKVCASESFQEMERDDIVIRKWIDSNAAGGKKKSWFA